MKQTIKGRIIDLVYLRQEHEESIKQLNKQRYELLGKIQHHNQEAIKLRKKIDEEIISREI